MQRGMLEYTIIRNWLGQWGEYLKVYHLCCLENDPSIESFFDLPAIETRWYRSNQEKEIVRYGMLYKAYDLVRRGKIVGILEEGSVTGFNRHYIYVLSYINYGSRGLDRSTFAPFFQLSADD